MSYITQPYASDHWATGHEPQFAPEAMHAVPDAEGEFMAEVSKILRAMDGDPAAAILTISHSRVIDYLDAALDAKLKELHPYAAAA
jgi:hypothetical protein